MLKYKTKLDIQISFEFGLLTYMKRIMKIELTWKVPLEEDGQEELFKSRECS